MKKIIRICSKLLAFYLFKILHIFFIKSNYKILPPIYNYKKLNFDYSLQTRRLVLKKEKKKFDKIYFDSTHAETELCLLGKKFKTNKSSLNLAGHRSGYTAFYSLIFNYLKHKKCNVAEIGIEKNGSTKMWREYFSKATIECFEKDIHKIKTAKSHKLKKTNYHYIDVSNPQIINNSFLKRKKKFDIIIDDSTHDFNHQINIIKNVNQFLKKNGILIIEDIFKFKTNNLEENYYKELEALQKLFSKITFVEMLHVNNFTSNYKCEKILMLVKK